MKKKLLIPAIVLAASIACVGAACSVKTNGVKKCTDHEVVHHLGQAATCEEDGWEAYDTCKNCSEQITEFKVIPATGHQYEGVECTVCGAVDPNAEKLEFELVGSNYAVTGVGSAEGTAIRVPAYHQGKKVTKIAEGAFSKNTSITEVSLPASIVIIEREAFYGCTALEKVSVHEGLGSIGVAAFSGCAKLKAFDLPESVTVIKESAFQGCAALKEVNLPAGLNTLGYQAFLDCSSLESITVPHNITVIDYNMFMNCTSLSSVTFAGEVKTIKWKAFYGCTALKQITLPDTVMIIGQDAFRKSALTSIALPATVNYIATGAFKDCAGLTSVTFGTASGWKVAEKTEIAEADLTNAATAATLLTTTHADEFWAR